MKTFKLEPVAWLTTLATVVVSLASVQETAHVLPPQAAGWLTAAAALGVVVLGRQVRAKVTPLAAPTAADGRTLTPEDGTAGASTPA